MADKTPVQQSGFRVRIAPSWEVVVAAVQQRADSLGLPWPNGLKAARYPRVYAITLAAESGPKVDGGTPLQVILWEPPKEYVATPNPIAAADVKVGFGLANKRVFTDLRADYPLDVISVWLDQAGLWLLPATDVSGASVPAACLQSVPLVSLMSTFSAVASGDVKLQAAGADHIVDKFVPPAGLENFRVSRWRGDASYRLSTPWVQLEIWPG